MSPGILACSETSEGAFELLTKGREVSKALGIELAAVVFGKTDSDCQPYFEYGAQKAILVPQDSIGRLDAETYANVLFEISKESGADILLLRSTRLGKETAGRVAQKLQAGGITDAIGLELRGTDLVVNRYALGGNTVSSEMIKSPKKVISFMPRTFEAQKAPAQGTVVKLDLKVPKTRVELVELRKKTSEAVNIESAETLVCVGKGISKKEDLEMVKELASLLGGELGCTRALSSDYHWISEDRMVGISGKRCKPKLDVSIGLSGQIQHTVGIMTSKLIVAINKDKEAPIFKMADYGIVGDLYQVVPKLVEKIKSTGKYPNPPYLVWLARRTQDDCHSASFCRALELPRLDPLSEHFDSFLSINGNVGFHETRYRLSRIRILVFKSSIDSAKTLGRRFGNVAVCFV